MASAGDIPLDLVACDRSVFDPQEGTRHAELLETIRNAVTESEEIDSGFRFTLGPAAFAAAAEWFSYERRCCPFFDFELSWPADAPSPTLTLMGPEGTRSFLAVFATAEKTRD